MGGGVRGQGRRRRSRVGRVRRVDLWVRKRGGVVDNDRGAAKEWNLVFDGVYNQGLWPVVDLVDEGSGCGGGSDDDDG